MFFKKNEIKNNNFLTKVCALLIHAAKIDENYTDKEEEIIKKTLNELGVETENISKTIEEAKQITNKEIAEALSLPAIKLHCSILAEEGIRKAIEDWEGKVAKRKHNQ